MIVAVDASAIVALALGEPEANAVDSCLQGAAEAYITPVNLIEAGLALVLRRGHMTSPQLQEWLRSQRVQQRHIDGFAALSVYLVYGKGIHRAGLNLGDCFAYALAKELDAPLLYKGSDFSWTDIRPALQPT
jgi:ribonuclease VapC